MFLEEGLLSFVFPPGFAGDSRGSDHGLRFFIQMIDFFGNFLLGKVKRRKYGSPVFTVCAVPEIDWRN